MAPTKFRYDSDSELIARVRGGESAAYGELWRRHSAAARVAARMSTTRVDPDDLVAEAYANILTAIKAGKGPDGAFRPYLYAVVRNLARAANHRDDPVEVEDFDLFTDPGSEVANDEMRFERSATVKAFRSLPERWQTILWYTEVEKFKPREVAHLMGLSANAASALAYRAREALRQAWLQEHVGSQELDDECRWVTLQLGAHVRAGLGSADRKRVQEHLDTCAHCTMVAAEVGNTNSRIAVVIGPLFLGGIGATVLAANLHADPAVAASLVAKPPTRFGTAPKVALIAAGTAIAVTAAAGLAIAAQSGTPLARTSPVASSPTATSLATPAPTPTPTLISTPEPTPPPAPTSPPTRNSSHGGGGSPAPTPTPTPSPTPTPDTTPPDAPQVTSDVLPDSGYRPSLAGTGEPGATITVTDQSGNVLAQQQVTSAGTWDVGELTALQVSTSQILVEQRDEAGNVSPQTSLGPFEFRPNFVTQAPVSCAVGGTVTLSVRAWDGTPVHLANTRDSSTGDIMGTTAATDILVNCGSVATTFSVTAVYPGSTGVSSLEIVVS